MRIMLYSRVNPADGGGVQAVAHALGDHLHRRGHHVLRAWRRPNPVAAGDVTCALPLITWRGTRPAPRSLLAAGRALLRLARIVARFRPDVVNCHFVTSECAYFLLLRPFFRFRLVLSAHGSDVLRPKPWNRTLLPRLLRHADAVTAVSRVTAERVSAIASRTRGIRRIANGVDVAFWSALRPASDCARDRVVLTVGRLHHVKGHDVLVRAFAIVRGQIPDARLVIGGEGDQASSLKRLASELRVSDAVEFAGRLDATAVRATLARAGAFALPSRSEGLPLALLEAMAAGTPVVACRVGGVPDVLTPGTGLMVPADNPSALAGALIQVLQAGPAIDAMAAEARARARQFSVHDAMAAYDTLFADLHTAGRRRLTRTTTIPEQAGRRSAADLHA